MEKDQDQKHKCKFCSKSFPCGRSLGGHMRSHLINITSSDRKRSDEKLPKKKLPPLIKPCPKPDYQTDGGDQLGSYGLRENPKKTSKFSKSSEEEEEEEEALLQEMSCKECGKSFQSWKALFGHMKCHSVNVRTANNVEEDSWNSCNDHQKVIMDSQSDNEAATPFCKRKRSERMKRYTANTNSSSLTIANPSPSVSDQIDHQEEEEVALSLIILSRDKGDWGGVNSVAESSDNSFHFLQPHHTAKTAEFNSKSSGEECLKFKKLKNVKTESQVTSPKIRPRKWKPIDRNDPSMAASRLHEEVEKTSKFSCSICKKAFPSYQALGGHRASHKKFKGLCAPRTENSHNQSDNPPPPPPPPPQKSDKDHECPICFKVFTSGQALGGHKRSHLIITDINQTKKDHSTESNKPIRTFLDLNLPAPDEEECNEFKPWWIGTSHKQQPLLGLISS